MSTHHVLDKNTLYSLGSSLIGLVAAGILLGVSFSQTGYYYTHQTDGWHLKSIVGVVVVCDLIHQVLITHSVYWITVTHWGDPAVLPFIIWSQVVECIFVGIITFLVQSFLALRVWHLSDHNKLLVGIIVLLILAQFVASNVAVGLIIHKTLWAEVLPLQWLTMLCNVLAVAGDVLIAASLCTLLHRLRTGARRSDTMITTLIIFTVNTGLLTSAFAVASLVSLVFARYSYLNMSFYWCIGRLYTNSLLATLNARKRIGAIGHYQDSSFSMNNIFESTSKPPTRSAKHQRDMSIKIDTAIALARDEHMDQGRDYKDGQIRYPSVTQESSQGDLKALPSSD